LAVVLYMPSAFDRFKREGEIIGRMVIEYGELEWDLCLLAGHITGDFNVALKAMYRSRGETQRIDIADALARNRLEPGSRVRTIYEQTIAHMRICLKIRNQYAHTNWVETASDGLCFVNIEEIAKANDVADTSSLQRYKLDLQTIEDQQRFFAQVMQNMQYLCMEVQYLNGSIDVQGFHYESEIRRPMEAKPLRSIVS
jgi:hypothetical protein